MDGERPRPDKALAIYVVVALRKKVHVVLGRVELLPLLQLLYVDLVANLCPMQVHRAQPAKSKGCMSQVVDDETLLERDFAWTSDQQQTYCSSSTQYA